MHKPMNITTVTGDMLKPGDIVYDTYPAKNYSVKMEFLRRETGKLGDYAVFKPLQPHRYLHNEDGTICFMLPTKFYWEYPKD